MLIPLPQGNGAARQITLTSSTSGEIMYTVPAGKTFSGFYFSAGSSPAIRVNGCTMSFSGYEHRPLTLIGGTVFANGSGIQLNLIGVEQ